MAIDDNALQSAGRQISSACSLLQSAAAKLCPESQGIGPAVGPSAQDKCNQTTPAYVPTPLERRMTESMGAAAHCGSTPVAHNLAANCLAGQCTVGLGWSHVHGCTRSPACSSNCVICSLRKKLTDLIDERDDLRTIIEALTKERDNLQSDHQKLELEMKYRDPTLADINAAYPNGPRFELRVPRQNETYIGALKCAPDGGPRLVYKY